jgi:glycosyltransferase involved in cell wall biosynthesis
VVAWREDEKKIGWLDYRRLKVLFKRALDQVKPDLVHAGPIQRVAYLPALAKFHPLLSMSWGFDMLEDAHRDPIWSAVTRYVLQRSDWFATDCQTVEKEAQKFGFPAEKVTVFPWGVDLAVFQPNDRQAARRKLGYADELLIVHTRSWEKRYGVDVALQGFRLAAGEVSNLRLLMLGGGSQERMVKDFVQRNGLGERVHFLGYQENDKLAEYYRAADVYLSASHIDGSSVALMESMACGCPALVSDIPANLEWVRDGQEGWVFHDKDAHSLAERMVEIARNRERISACGLNARRKAESNANWQVNFEKLLAAYRKLVPQP